MTHHPLDADYQRLLDVGTKPNLARLTIARRIAALVLAMWKHEDVSDPTKHRSHIIAQPWWRRTTARRSPAPATRHTKPILEFLDIDRETELDMRTDGERLIIEPVRSARRAKVKAAAQRAMAAHDATLGKLAK